MNFDRANRITFLRTIALSGFLGILPFSLTLTPTTSKAQGFSFGVDETEDTAEEPAKKEPSTSKKEESSSDATASGGDGGGFSFSETETEKPAEEKPSADTDFSSSDSADSGSTDDLFADLAETGKDDQKKKKPVKKQKEVAERIYAIQQIYSLRKGRFEIAPSIGFTLNDPYVSHTSVGASFNYWWTNVLAVGINFNWYQFLEDESDLTFNVRRSTRLAIPITEYQLGLNLNFTYVPLYGKFSMFDYIFQWDAYVVGGVGVMRTRPVPVFDPVVRDFDFDWRIAFNAGVGIRVFITKFLAIYAELRDYAYLERLENRSIALGVDRNNPNTWIDSSPSLTNNVTAHLGINLFIPFGFDYQLPK